MQAIHLHIYIATFSFVKSFPPASFLREDKPAVNWIMYLTRSVRYALKLSLSPSTETHTFRKSFEDRGTVGSAVFLATVGLSISMISLKQMLSSHSKHQRVD